LYHEKGKKYPYEELDARLYGYNNRYGMFAKRFYGGVNDTYKAEEGLFEVSLIGTGSKAEEIRKVYGNEIRLLVEPLNETQIKNISNLIKQNIDLENIKVYEEGAKVVCKGMSEQNISTLEGIVQNIEERQPLTEVKSNDLNPNYDNARRFKEANPEDIIYFRRPGGN